MLVFRSLLVPLKAVVMNLLSIAAAYGVVTAVFQWGWFGSVLNIEPAPIEPFVPMMMFAIVFGLSMDYEVFLLSRIREEYVRTGDSRLSVADGLASTARVITAAAAIMVVVFGSFIGESDRIVKLFGVGLSIAVLLDATIVRMLLVPATMELLGDSNWWLPKWLDRALPRVAVEGHPLEVEPRARDRVSSAQGEAALLQRSSAKRPSVGRQFRHPGLEALGRCVGEEPGAKRLLRGDVLRMRWSETSRHSDPRTDLIQGERGHRAQGDAIELRHGVVEDTAREVDPEESPVLI